MAINNNSATNLSTDKNNQTQVNSNNSINSPIPYDLNNNLFNDLNDSVDKTNNTCTNINPNVNTNITDLNLCEMNLSDSTQKVSSDELIIRIAFYTGKRKIQVYPFTKEWHCSLNPIHDMFSRNSMF